MADAFVDLIALLGDTRRLSFRRATRVTTHAHGVETTTLTTTIFTPTTIVTLTTRFVTTSSTIRISFSRTERPRP